ncbi:MAG: adenylate/guanylate cyclase domain-containing protein, partial [Spirochaetaceae bacterium]|nr:adenylate/guanylate cyclase domain-containing protein [Spirochaetaceae bacterium]
WVGSVLYRYLVVEKQRQKVRSIFSRFVSREVVDSILDSGRAIELGGETREVVIFFSDICGFTPLSASMSPADVVEMLNEYFTDMTDIIFRHGGTVNKYIGDAIMAFYGAPVPLPNASERAVRACLDMRTALESFNEKREQQGKPAIGIGMGLHKGRVLVGNIGSPRQMEYTVIGDAVNVSSRIEGLTRVLNTDLLISDDVYQDVKDLVTVETFDPTAVKGKSEKIVVHTVTGLRGDHES